MGEHLSWNTAVSFTTNTNWQSYVPESTMSYLSQMVGAGYTQLLFGRGGHRGGDRGDPRILAALDQDSGQLLGGFHALPRSTSCCRCRVVAALLLCSQGVIQNLDPYTKVTTLEGTVQTIPQGPVASQEAIKMLGTNGGGFFNANSAHPFENPTPLSNFIEMVLIFLIPAGLTYTFGKMVKDTRQGWALLAAMTILFLAGVFIVYPAEQAGNPVLTQSRRRPGGNMEGKEVRFGIANSALFTVVTTDASCGAVNNMHDSLTPLGGLVPLVNIELGEVVFGGVGSGLYGMLLFAILAVFIAGLMVGRTPEYLGKKIEQKEVKMVMLAVWCWRSASWASPRSGHRPGDRQEQPEQQRAARLKRSAVRLYQRRRQQRQRLRRNQRQHAVPQHHARHRDALRTLPDADSAAGGGRQPGAKETRAGLGRHVPHARSAVRRAAGGRGRDRGRADVLPGASLGPIVEHFLMHQGRLWS